MAPGLVKGFASKTQPAPRQGESGEPNFLGVSPTATVVVKPGLRRRIFQEARGHLDQKKSSEAPQAPKALLKHAAESLRRSIRDARLAHSVTELLSPAPAADSSVNLERDIAGVRKVLHQFEAKAGEGENASAVDARSLRQVLEDIKKALSVARLNNQLEEAQHILNKVQELEALIEESECQAAIQDLSQALAESRHASPVPSERRPSSSTAEPGVKAVDGRASLKAFVTGRKTSQGSSTGQECKARRNSTRSQLRDALRTSNGWIPLPPAVGHDKPKPEQSEEAEPEEGPRRRESWLKWWPGRFYSEGYALHQRAAFFESLPKEKLNEEEMELRDAIIAFLESRRGQGRGQEMPTLEEIADDSSVSACIQNALPECVTLEDWVHERQSLGRAAAPASRLSAPTSAAARWKKDPPFCEPEEPEHRRKFQRRDTFERRPSFVFGLNFSVSEKGQICGRVAGFDDESVCDLPWPSTSVVPEQKSFQWIREVGAGTRRLLPSVTSRASGMVLEEVLAWRLSHRYRCRKVEPVLENMWQAYRGAKHPSTVPSCHCEWCCGKLQYDICHADH